jgi:hypothetical protein
VLADIPDTQGCHGVAIAPDAGRRFMSDSKGVTVFDLKTFKPLGEIAAGQGPDGICFDLATKSVTVIFLCLFDGLR